MSIAVNSILPVVAAQGVSHDIAFQPGSVIAARVVSVSPDNQVRIAIGNSAIDVQSQVPLQPGQTLQLAVSQTADGIRLAIIPSSTSAAAPQVDPSLANVTLAPDAAANLVTTLAASKIQLTALEAQAVSTATQTAVTQQASLSTLFANLGAITTLQGLPPKLQQAVAQLLAQRPPLDTQLTGGEVKSAFQNSGLFLESSLAGGSLPQGVPDMKAALIVLRQALTTTLGVTDGTGAAQPGASAVPNPVVVAAQPAAGAASTSSLMPVVVAQGSRAQAGLPVADDGAETAAQPPTSSASTPSSQPATRAANAALPGALQTVIQGNPRSLGASPALAMDDAMLMETLLSPKPPAAAPASAQPIARSNVPPPPLRGALPTAQPMALPTLPAEASLTTTVHHLLSDTDAALARQTLMQVASLPDRSDGINPSRLDQAAPRWNFEIPFAMPNGTAVAQFEISRDGGNGSEAEAAKRVWRARFSLDVEPAGPVHALVSLSGDRTSVRMWAERPSTAVQLQAGSAQLNQALVRANLQPGDIVIREGAPVQPAPAAAGHFLDRAL